MRNLPIGANSINSSNVPPHLRREKKSYGITDKILLNSLYSQELGELDAINAESILDDYMIDFHAKNDVKWKVAIAYDTNLASLDAVEWHIIQYDTEVLKGDRGFVKAGNWFFKAAIKGRYLVTADVRIVAQDEINPPGPDREEWIQSYAAKVMIAYPDENYLIAVYNRDNTQKEIIGAFPIRTCRFVSGSPDEYYYSYLYNIPLQGTTELYLDAGEEIDIRVNLLQYILPAFVCPFKIIGNVSIHFVDELENTI